jgi:hypothetical protein
MLERCKVVMEFHKYLVNSDGENGDADEMIYSLFIQKDKSKRILRSERFEITGTT